MPHTAASNVVEFQSVGKLNTLRTSVWLAAELASVYDFFADALKLESITPPWLHFRVLTAQPIVIQQGITIDYRLRLHGLPMDWRSEISVWEPPHRFVDRQLIGPYQHWVHEHTFRPADGGDAGLRSGRLSLRRWMADRPSVRPPRFTANLRIPPFRATENL